MQKSLENLFINLQTLVGLHKQLLDTVRMEREALVQVDLKSIDETTHAKQALIEAIRHAEAARQRTLVEVSLDLKTPVQDLTLSEIAIRVQGEDQKKAEHFRSLQNTLVIMIQRITDQNEDNRQFLEHSLEHVRAMQGNARGTTGSKSQVYGQHGKKVLSAPGGRFISKEV
ncbi:flagellar protein FlgN [Bdellovibrionota bacterium FG-2]